MITVVDLERARGGPTRRALVTERCEDTGAELLAAASSEPLSLRRPPSAVLAVGAGACEGPTGEAWPLEVSQPPDQLDGLRARCGALHGHAQGDHTVDVLGAFGLVDPPAPACVAGHRCGNVGI